MKTLFIICALGVIPVVLHFGIIGVIPYICCVAPLCYGVMWCVKQYLHAQTLKAYGNYTENIYVYSLHEQDNTVRKRAQHERTMLDTAGNRLGVEVVAIYYQDAEYRNETWEQFEQRRDETILQDKQKRALHIKHKDPDFFTTHFLLQE